MASRAVALFTNLAGLLLLALGLALRRDLAAGARAYGERLRGLAPGTG